MKKGLIIANLNRAKKAENADKIAYFQKMLDDLSLNPNVKKTVSNNNSVETAIERLHKLKDSPKISRSFCEYDNQSYSVEMLKNLSDINLKETKFFRVKHNGFTEQVFYND
jgi:hypothetical protein